MKRLIYKTVAIALVALPLTGCLEEVDPMGYNDRVSKDQVSDAPGSYDNFVGSITTNLCGQNLYTNFFGASLTSYPYDFGYPGMLLLTEAAGNDFVPTGGNNPLQYWYTNSVGITAGYAICQVPWTCFYIQIKNCNEVLSLAGEEPEADKVTGAGIAHAMRAMYYMTLGQMYCQKPYTVDPQALTVPIVTENTELSAADNNPRATQEVLFNTLILPDLDKAEGYLAGYSRSDKYTPDVSVVYGLKARAYLYMGQWALAEEYAKKAMAGYGMMSQNEYLDRETGFNTPNGSWMFAGRFKSDDPTIIDNDADSSWGSLMVTDMEHHASSSCGYAANYGCPSTIDYHLYQTIPDTDFRKLLWVDFEAGLAAQSLKANSPTYAEDCEALLGKYTDYPTWLQQLPNSNDYGIGGVSMKFRPNGGLAGRQNQYVGFLVSVPLMRVEEMKLIEAEAAGMQSEARGIALLTAFAQTRDPQYVYGRHNEAYGNNATSAFQNEVWWQRRVELWGEGFSMFDVKRLQKGIIRSYAGSNHVSPYKWNLDQTPSWMTFMIGGTDPTYNIGIIQNPTPTSPTGDSPEHVW